MERHTAAVEAAAARSSSALGSLRVHLRVRPGASRDHVGGRYGDTDPPLLVVAVQARAVDGAANRAVTALVARAFNVRPRDVSLVSGERSRLKVVTVTGDLDVLAARRAGLLAAP